MKLSHEGITPESGNKNENLIKFQQKKDEIQKVLPRYPPKNIRKFYPFRRIF